MENRRLTMDELSQKLVNSKKVMNKVDNGDFTKGNVNANLLKSAPEELVAENSDQLKSRPTAKKPQPLDPKRIQESKLPDAIKRAMIDNPIPQIGLDTNLDMDFVEKTRALMEQDGQYIPRKQRESVQETYTEPARVSSSSSGDLESKLTPIIENIIRKTLDDIVDKKLNQILTAQESKSINEGLAIKVGNTIFTGKLTKAKSIK